MSSVSGDHGSRHSRSNPPNSPTTRKASPRRTLLAINSRARSLSRNKTMLPASCPASTRCTLALFPLMGGGAANPRHLLGRIARLTRLILTGLKILNQQPHNWPLRCKLLISIGLVAAAFCVVWCSSILASGVGEIAKEFHVGLVVAILGISLYVLGFPSGNYPD